jgi:predicted nucleotide-binding protein
MSPDPQSLDKLLTDLERGLVKVVIDRFLNLKEATSQKSLEIRFRDPDAVARLVRYGLITLPSNQKHCPTVLGIDLCGDRNQIQRARSALETVLHVLRNLFEIEADKQDFSFAEIETHAREMYGTVSSEDLSLGLYLVAEFPVLAHYSPTQTQIERLALQNGILKIKDVGNEWDRHVRDRRRFLEDARAPHKRNLFLKNLGSLQREHEGDLIEADVHRIASGSGFQWDEISQLIDSCESDRLLVRDPKSDAFTLTDAGLARIEVIKRRDAKPAVPKAAGAKVFVVHGRNEAVKRAVARFLRKLRLEPIILQERPNKGKTLIEKFEANSNDVEFAVVLLTPDDSGGPASKLKNRHPRARQNVILELGYFIGKLGRDKVCPILVPRVETPSDIHGVVYVPYDATGIWRRILAKEISAAGIEIDWTDVRVSNPHPAKRRST